MQCGCCIITLLRAGGSAVDGCRGISDVPRFREGPGYVSDELHAEGFSRCLGCARDHCGHYCSSSYRFIWKWTIVCVHILFVCLDKVRDWLVGWLTYYFDQLIWGFTAYNSFGQWLFLFKKRAKNTHNFIKCYFLTNFGFQFAIEKNLKCWKSNLKSPGFD